MAVQCKDSCEGILSSNCAVVGVRYGWYFDYGVQLGVLNSHVNVQYTSGTSACVYVSGIGAADRVDQAMIIGNLFYPDQANTNGIKGTFYHSQICNNVFNSASDGANTTGIDLLSDSQFNSLSNNVFRHMINKGIYLESGTSNNIGSSNVFDACGTNVSGSGVNGNNVT